MTFSKKSADLAVAAEAGSNVEFGKAAAAPASAGGRTGTPEKVTAALGIAHEVRLRRAEAWAAGRKKKQAEGGSKGRNRGKGARLRRQMVKQQQCIDRWRQQQHAQAERVVRS